MLKRAALVNMCVFTCMNFSDQVNAQNNNNKGDLKKALKAQQNEQKLKEEQFKLQQEQNEDNLKQQEREQKNSLKQQEKEQEILQKQQEEQDEILQNQQEEQEEQELLLFQEQENQEIISLKQQEKEDYLIQKELEQEQKLELKAQKKADDEVEKIADEQAKLDQKLLQSTFRDDKSQKSGGSNKNQGINSNSLLGTTNNGYSKNRTSTGVVLDWWKQYKDQKDTGGNLANKERLDLQFSEKFPCNKNQYRNQDGRCQQCEEGCQDCQDDGGECFDCDAGYRLENGQCQICNDEFCAKCEESQGMCTDCQLAYYLNQDTQTCQRCNGECDECDDDGVCLDDGITLGNSGPCQDGQFYGVTPPKCLDCDPSCKTCDNKNTCLTCKDDNYFKNAFGTCGKCPASCLSCNAADQCTACLDGLDLITGQCFACYADVITVTDSIPQSGLTYQIGSPTLVVEQLFDRVLSFCSAPTYQIFPDASSNQSDVIAFDTTTSQLSIQTDDQALDGEEWEILYSASNDPGNSSSSVEGSFIVRFEGECTQSAKTKPTVASDYSFYLSNEERSHQFTSNSLNCQEDISYKILDAITKTEVDFGNFRVDSSDPSAPEFAGQPDYSDTFFSQYRFVIRKEVNNFGYIDSDIFEVNIVNPCDRLAIELQPSMLEDLFTTVGFPVQRQIPQYSLVLDGIYTADFTYDFCTVSYAIYLQDGVTPVDPNLLSNDQDMLVFSPIDPSLTETIIPVMLRVTINQANEIFINEPFDLLICSDDPLAFTSLPQVDDQLYILGSLPKQINVADYGTELSVCYKQNSIIYTATLQDGSELPSYITFDPINLSLSIETQNQLNAGFDGILITGTSMDQTQSPTDTETINFQLQVLDCSTNQVQFITNVNDQKYYIGDEPLEIIVGFSSTEPNCQLSPSIDAIDKPNSSRRLMVGHIDGPLLSLTASGEPLPFTVMESETGNQYKVIIKTDDLLYNDKYMDVILTVAAIGSESQDTIEFTVYTVSRCQEAILTAPRFDQDSYQLSVSEDASISFTPMKDTSIPEWECGLQTYKLYDEELNLVDPENDYQIDSTDQSNPKIVGMPALTDPWFAQSTRTYFVIGYLGTFGQTNPPVQVDIEFESPCKQTQIISSQLIRSDITNKVLGGPISRQIPTYTDTLSTQYTKDGSNYDLCGIEQSYELLIIYENMEIPMFQDLLYIDQDNKIIFDVSNNGYAGQVFPVVLRVTLKDGSTRDDPFNVIVNACQATIDTLPTIQDQTYSIEDSELQFSLSSFTFTPSCSYTFDYEVQLTDGSQLPSDLISFDSSSLTFSVETEDASLAGSYSIRVIATMNNQAQSSDYIDFEMQVSIDCDKDTVTVMGTENLEEGANQEYKYIIGDTNLVVIPEFEQKYPSCPLVYVIDGVEQSTGLLSSTQPGEDELTLLSTNPSDGSFEIFTNDLAYNKQTTTVQVTIQLQNPDNSVDIQYDINILSRCEEASLTSLTFEQQSYIGQVLEPFEIEFTPVSYSLEGIEDPTTANCGDILYTLYDTQLQAVASTDSSLEFSLESPLSGSYQIDVTDAQSPKLLVSPQANIQDGGQFFMVAKLGEFAQAVPVTVSITIESPCKYATIETDVPIQSFSVDVFTQTGYEQLLSTFTLTNVPANPAIECGLIQQELRFASSTEDVPSDLARLESDSIVSSPSSNVYVSQTFFLVLRSYLSDYDVEIVQEFAITVTECVPSIFSGTPIDDVAYNIYTPAKVVTFGEFFYLPDECFFSFTYSAVIEETLFKTDSPAITFESDARSFNVESSDPLQVGLYNITITATLNNQESSSDDSMFFFVGILNECLQDQVTTAQSSIAPMTYKVGDDPLVLEVFSQSVEGCPVNYIMSLNSVASIDQATGNITIFTDNTSLAKNYTIVAAATSNVTGSRTSINFLLTVET